MTAPGPHCYTLTGNLLAERTLDFERWATGATNRARAESFQVGGKGVNVTRMLTRLGAPATALCFTGGASGDECRAWLARQAFAHRVFGSDRPTRVGLVVRSPGQPETTFFSPDAPPGPAAIRACAEFLEALPDGQALAVCGSVPGWADATFDPLRDALERWLRRGLLVADTYGPPLQWLADRPVALIKVNAVEFQGLAGSTAGRGSSTIDAVTLAASARSRPARNWIVTSGSGPVWIRPESGEPACAEPPRVHEISPTGSGDVLLAAVLDAWWRRGLSLAEAVAFALPLAAANAAHAGVAEFPWPGLLDLRRE